MTSIGGSKHLLLISSLRRWRAATAILWSMTTNDQPKCLHQASIGLLRLKALRSANADVLIVTLMGGPLCPLKVSTLRRGGMVSRHLGYVIER